ncbi:MAG: alpha/beta fold hydrolase [Anaerolineaceae bacterium]|nr:alpha/beta fold hydrolase [Anaerolineaceae bacterium]
MYKSAAGQQKITEWYDDQINKLGLHSRIIRTSFGDTNIIEAGQETLPALILIAGTNFSALSWQTYIESLSGSYHVVAVDVVGQPGKSAPNRPSFKGTAYAEWLLAVLDALNIESASLIGHSLGGWIALKLAAYASKRISKIILLDPGGIIPLSITPRIIWKSTPFVIFPGEASSRGLLSMLSVKPLEQLTVEWMTLVSKHFKSSLAPPAIPAQELQAIQADILLMVGDQDVFLPAQKLVEKARELFPKLKTIVVPNSGHLLPDDQQQIVLTHVDDFLSHDLI